MEPSWSRPKKYANWRKGMKRSSFSAEDLRNFEERIAAAFNAGRVLAPVHLYSGNEEEMIQIFQSISESDWVICTWRSHYQCLLKGVPEDELFAEIISGRSMSLCFPEYKIFSSAIAGGSLPIATGLALSLQRKKSQSQVHCFIGDMTAESGIAHECIKYSENHDLPIRFIVEDNGKSVLTDTFSTWGMKGSSFASNKYRKVVYYQYENSYPHAGAGVRVQF